MADSIAIRSRPSGTRRARTLLGAPSSLGVRPYDQGGARRLDLAPDALRRASLTDRLGARDAGDLVAPPYRDLVRTPGAIRNEGALTRYLSDVAGRIDAAAADGDFLVLLGGDCSVVLAALRGVGRNRRVGLVYIDAHADFATPTESRSGSAASMCLALAVGRSDSPLGRLGGEPPLVHGADVALVGRRADDRAYGLAALQSMPILDLPHDVVRRLGIAETARRVLARVTRDGVDGFWVHVDADVLDPRVMPAVDTPEADGLEPEELLELLTPLVRHPGALGVELTIYDPTLDSGGAAGRLLVDLLARALGEGDAP